MSGYSLEQIGVVCDDRSAWTRGVVDYRAADGVQRRGFLESVHDDGTVCVLALSGNDDEIGADDVVALWHRGQLVAVAS